VDTTIGVVLGGGRDDGLDDVGGGGLGGVAGAFRPGAVAVDTVAWVMAAWLSRWGNGAGDRQGAEEKGREERAEEEARDALTSKDWEGCYSTRTSTYGMSPE
jgi:hypothetical protein